MKKYVLSHYLYTWANYQCEVSNSYFIHYDKEWYYLNKYTWYKENFVEAVLMINSNNNCPSPRQSHSKIESLIIQLGIIIE